MNKTGLLFLVFVFCLFPLSFGQVLDDGIHREYYGSGKLKTESTVRDRKLDGLLKVYFENGNIMSEENYVLGIKQGMTRHYYPTGSLYEEMTYVNDEVDGTVKVYYENGTLRLEVSYKAGIKDGILKAFTEDGKLEYQHVFEDGRMLDENGGLMNGTVSFTMNGVVKEQTTYQDGLPIEGAHAE